MSPKIEPMPSLHVLRVFVNDEGEWGNPLGVFLDGVPVPEGERQGIAAELGFSETVFVEDRAGGRIRIHTPTVELPFAGHPTVGVAWLLAREGTPVESLLTPAGEVSVRYAENVTYVTADPSWSPQFEHLQVDSPAAVRAMHPGAHDVNTYVWAWIDEAAGTIRARGFFPALGIAEDEATGSAAIALCKRLARPLTIHQGRGSVLQCRSLAENRVEVGGMARLVEYR